MRWQKLGLFLLTLITVALVPSQGQALVVRLCVPNCATDPAVSEGTNQNQFTSLEGQTEEINGVWTTTFPVTLAYKGFTVSGTIKSEQSGTLQRIKFEVGTVIRAPGGCTSTSPCKIEVMATSQPTDFPIPKPAGGFPAGAFMSGKFDGTSSDTISAIGESSGLDSASQPVSTEVINLTPGTGDGNTGATLPHTCVGNPSCKFTASGTFRRSFYTELSETIQQECGVVDDSNTPISSCLTQLRTRFNLEFKTANNAVTLPFSYEKHNIDPKEEEEWLKDPRKAITNPTKELIKSALVPLGDFNVGQLVIGNNNFAMTAKLKVAPETTIDPSADETYFSIGGFTLLISPQMFKKQPNGTVFSFHGRIEPLNVGATFVRDRKDPSAWAVVLGVHGVQLPVPGPADPQIPVKMAVGAASGTDLVEPKGLPTAPR